MIAFWIAGMLFTLGVTADTAEDTFMSGVRDAAVHFFLWPLCLGLIAKELIKYLEAKSE